jgi:hypothetical protein
VPKIDAAWPREFHCMKLGNALHGVRCGMTYKDRKEEFEALGLDVRVRGRRRPTYLARLFPRVACLPACMPGCLRA